MVYALPIPAISASIVIIVGKLGLKLSLHPLQLYWHALLLYRNNNCNPYLTCTFFHLPYNIPFTHVSPVLSVKLVSAHSSYSKWTVHIINNPLIPESLVLSMEISSNDSLNLVRELSLENCSFLYLLLGMFYA